MIKIIKEIDTYLQLLERSSKYFQSGESTHQWLLGIYLKGDESFENVMGEFKLDKSDFLLYLHEIEIRCRALRDMLNPFNIKIEEITKTLKDNNLIPYRIAEIKDIDGLCFHFKKDGFFVYLEIYQDLDMGYIVSDEINKKIIVNVDIQSINEFISYMKDNN